MASIKQTLADGFETTGLSRGLLDLQARTWRPHIRAVNYHDVPPGLAGAFESQLRLYARHYDAVGLEELRAFRRGEWRSERPGLIISFDDGLRSHGDVAAPLLERHGFPGWFMVPSAFPDVPAADQRAWAAAHSILFDPDAFADDRIALTWDDVARLDERHVIACHTASHQRLTAKLTEDQLEAEIARPKRALERRLGHEVSVFAWVGGEEDTYSRAAAETIQAAGYEFGFMTNNALIHPTTNPLQLQRSNIEATFPDALVEFTLSGFYDLMYWPKRRRVNAETRT